MATTTAPANFPAVYAAARHALAEAKRHTAPLDAELDARLREWNPEKHAAMELAVAAIAVAIPALQAEFDRLDELACHRCTGSGEYAGVSRHYKRGIKICFSCGGSGVHR